MKAHTFDVVSALLGLATLAGAAIVIRGDINPLAGQHAGVWVTIAAVLGGIAILPWSRRKRRTPEDPTT